METKNLIICLVFATFAGIVLTACAPSGGSEMGVQGTQPNSQEKSIYVGPLLVDCVGEGPQKCMLVKENLDDDYDMFYDQIEGFEYEEGYEYKLLVREEPVENPPAGGSSLKWSLVQVESKQAVPIAGDVIEKTIYVGPELVDCVGVAPQKCMLIKENPEDDYTFFYDQIEGFEYEQGYEYELIVRVEPVDNPPADASMLKWTLVSITSKTPIAQSGATQLEGPEWVLLSYINGEGEMTEALPGVKTTAHFQNGELNGNAGCNGYFGSYETEDLQISFGPLASTEMYCVNPAGVMDQETAYLQALERVESYSIQGNQLLFLNGSGESLLTYAIAEPVSLTGKMWQVINYNNGKDAVVSVLGGTEITANFDAESRLSGSAGCNNYSAPYEIDDSSIKIGPAIATRMACGEPAGIMEQEMGYLAALEMASSYKIENDHLILLDLDGNQVVTYQPTRTFELTDTIWDLNAYDDGEGSIVSGMEGVEATIIFNEDGSFGGSAGCNSYSGNYQVDGADMNLELGPVTMMFCEEPAGVMDQEAAYLEDLQAVATFRISGDRLVMMDDSGRELLQYLASDLVGYDWKWVDFLGNDDTRTSPTNPSDYTLRFRPDGQVAIQADCNQVLGSYQLNGNQVDIDLGITTLAACPPDSLSDLYLRLISDAVIYFREGEFLYLDIMLDTGTMKFLE